MMVAAVGRIVPFAGQGERTAKAGERSQIAAKYSRVHAHIQAQ
jgi:hypothetical protein